MLWLSAYLTGFPPVGLHALRWTHGLAPMWSGLYLISTLQLRSWFQAPSGCQCPLGLISHFYIRLFWPLYYVRGNSVNALSGLYLISTESTKEEHYTLGVVSMPSRAYTSFLPISLLTLKLTRSKCQCPLGLIPHFYPMESINCRYGNSLCQCPLGLIPHFYYARL